MFHRCRGNTALFYCPKAANSGLFTTVVPRFNAAGGDGERLVFIKEDVKRLTFGDDRIREAVEQCDAKLLILDPMSSYIGDDCSMNNANETRAEFNHLLIQTISRVDRKYPGKGYGLIVDYIGIRDNMRQAMKLYGSSGSVAPTQDDVEQATNVFRDELGVLKQLFTGYDLTPFLSEKTDPVERYRALANAAEHVFSSTEELHTESRNGTQKVSFKTYFLKTVKQMRVAYEICQPSGELHEDESALAQCFMAIAGFVRKMSGTTDVDTDTMNRNVARMVEEALKYNHVESILDNGEEENIFSPEYFEKLSDVRMPATKLEILVKMMKRQIREYSAVNQLAAKSFEEMLEATIREYHERRKHLAAEEAGEAQEQASEEIIQAAYEQALDVLRQMKESRESFRKIGLTFEEKAFYDILLSLRDQYNFEYGTDQNVGGVIVNDKCKTLKSQRNYRHKILFRRLAEQSERPQPVEIGNQDLPR